jgi:DNA processing protein
MSNYGKYLTQKITNELAGAGISIVSGLALGVDACAHQATLDANGKTYAVLGNGLDAIYPRTNARLAQSIIDAGGGVITEFPPGTLPLKQNFPQRNRIIAGLSRGVLVTEAAQRSGSLITARFALEFGRDVFAIPGDINRENAAGTNDLLKHGAAMVTSADDIISAWGITVHKKNETVDAQLNDIERKIIFNLNESMHVDKIAALTRLDISAANAALTILEIKGIVISLGGNIYAKR